MSEEKAIQFDELIFERIIDIGCEMLKAEEKYNVSNKPFPFCVPPTVLSANVRRNM